MFWVGFSVVDYTFASSRYMRASVVGVGRASIDSDLGRGYKQRYEREGAGGGG
jgi:hypothetical protein